MANYMDYTVSTKPIRVAELKVDRKKLKVKTLTIVDVGHIPGRTMYREHLQFNKNRYAVLYITGGSGTFQVNYGEKQPVKEGSLFLFYPGDVFCFGPDPGTYWDEYYFTLQGPRVQEWLDTWLYATGTVKQVGTDEVQIRKINRIFMLMESGVPSNVDRAALLLESLLLELMMNCTDSTKINKEEAISKLIEDISESLYRPFDALELCDRHHISLSTLRRTVFKYSGYPLNEYVHRLKMAEAKNILLNSQRSLKEIANSLGYHDVFYFSRIFKKFVGVAPNTYKKNF